MKNDDLKPFKIGNFRQTDKRRDSKSEKYPSYPFLEKLLEMEEDEVNNFLRKCEMSCKNIDNLMKRAKNEDEILLYQSILTAFGHSLSLLNELLEEKFKRAEKLKEEK